MVVVLLFLLFSGSSVGSQTKQAQNSVGVSQLKRKKKNTVQAFDMPQSSIRRYNFGMGMAVTVVFACVIAYMANTHQRICAYDHFVELQRRAVAVTTMLELLPWSSALEAAVDNLATTGTTSNAVTLSAYDSTAPTFQSGSSAAPYTVTVSSQVLQRRVTVTQSDVRERTHSCRPLVVGNGLCVLVCFLSLQLVLSQCGNLLAQRGLRIAGVASCWLAHIVGIAFVVGLVVLLGRTQRYCRAHQHGEDMHSTLALTRDTVYALMQVDSSAISVEKLFTAMSFVNTAFGQQAQLAPRNDTWPSRLPYYTTLLGGGLLPENEHFVDVESYPDKTVVGAAVFADRVGELVFYVEEMPQERYLLDEEYVSYALTLGIVPCVVVALVGIALLPYASLGALESGDEGIFPWQWRMSRAAGEVKLLHFAFVLVVVISMLTVALTSTNGNTAIINVFASQSEAFREASSRATTVATALFSTLVDISRRSYMFQANLPSGAATAEQQSELEAFYSTLYGLQGTMLYNLSSVRDALRRDASPPLLMQSGPFLSVVAESGTLDESTLLTLLATMLDQSLFHFAQTSNVSAFEVARASTYLTMSRVCNTSSGRLRQFQNAWDAYTTNLTPYNQIAETLAAQPYQATDVAALYATPQAVRAAAVEDSIITRSLAATSQPVPSLYISNKYAAYQIESALAVTLPAIILLVVAALWDSYFTHTFFALQHKWVPSNDKTALRSRVAIDHARLSSNLRVIIASTLILCVALVVLVSVVSTEGLVAAALEYMESQSAADVLISKKQLLTAEAKLMMTSFWWTRGVLSRTAKDLTLATDGVLAWSSFFGGISSVWNGMPTAVERSVMVRAISQIASVTMSTVFASGLRAISPALAYDQMSEVLEYVMSTRPAVSLLADCVGLDEAARIATLCTEAFSALQYARGAEAVNTATAQLALHAVSNTTGMCPTINHYLSNVSFFLPIAYGLMLTDRRIDVASLGSLLQGNSSAVSKAAQPYLRYTPTSLQRSSAFSLFWVPVLMSWLVLPLAHCVFRRSADTMRSTNYAA